MLATVRRLTRLSAVYALGDIVVKGVGFLLLPLYTRFLTPADYGIIALTTMIGAVLNVLLSFGMTGAILRFYPLTPAAERPRFFGALWALLVIIPGIGTLLLDQFGAPLFALLFRQTPFDPYIRLTLWSTWLLTAFGLLPPTLFRAREQAGRYIGFSLFTFSATTLATIGLVVLLGRGARGAVEAQFLAAALTAGLALVVLLRETRPNLRWAQLQPALAYGLPLLPHFLAHWALGVSDRAILERYVGLDQLGIYLLGYQFGMIYQMFNTSANNALMPMFSRAATDQRERDLLPRVTTYYALVIAATGLAIALLAGEAITLALPAAYHPARTIVPLVVLGYLAMGLYALPMNALALTLGKTRAVGVITASAAALNIGLNLLLVPHWGILAAAVNTALGYAALAGLVFWRSQRARPFPYEYGRLGKIALAVAAIYALGCLLLRFGPLVNLSGVLLLLALLPLALAALGFWNAAEKEQIARLRRKLAFAGGREERI